VVALYCGQAWTLLGEWDEALVLLGEAHTAAACRQAREMPESVVARQAEATLWLALLAERDGDTEAAQRYMEEARLILTRPDETAAGLRPLLGAAEEP